MTRKKQLENRQTERGQLANKEQAQIDKQNRPSSGSIVKVKFKISSGSGMCILIVGGKDNSDKSGSKGKIVSNRSD